jgi:hypothetical protein
VSCGNGTSVRKRKVVSKAARGFERSIFNGKLRKLHKLSSSS